MAVDLQGNPGLSQKMMRARVAFQVIDLGSLRHACISAGMASSGINV